MLADQLRNIADDLISQYGDDAILTQVVSKGYTPALHKNDTTVINHKVKIVKSAITSDEIVEGLIGINDIKATLYAKDFDIDTSWKLDGRNILTVSKVGLQNNIVIYEIVYKG